MSPNPTTNHNINLALQHALTRPIANDDCHTGTTGDSMSELSDSSAGRSAIGSALGSTLQFGTRTPHSGAPVAVHSRRREPLFGPAGSKVYARNGSQLVAAVNPEGRANGPDMFHDAVECDEEKDDGRNAMATLSAAALDAGSGEH